MGGGGGGSGGIKITREGEKKEGVREEVGENKPRPTRVCLVCVQKPVSQGDVFAEDAAEVLAAVDIVGCHGDPKELGTGVLRCSLNHALKDAGRCCRCTTGRNRNSESSSRVLLKRDSFRQNPD